VCAPPVLLCVLGSSSLPVRAAHKRRPEATEPFSFRIAEQPALSEDVGVTLRCVVFDHDLLSAADYMGELCLDIGRQFNARWTGRVVEATFPLADPEQRLVGRRLVKQARRALSQRQRLGQLPHGELSLRLRYAPDTPPAPRHFTLEVGGGRAEEGGGPGCGHHTLLLWLASGGRWRPEPLTLRLTVLSGGDGGGKNGHEDESAAGPEADRARAAATATTRAIDSAADEGLRGALRLAAADGSLPVDMGGPPAKASAPAVHERQQQQQQQQAPAGHGVSGTSTLVKTRTRRGTRQFGKAAETAAAAAAARRRMRAKIRAATAMDVF
jgi:hypothetical protein